MKLIVFLILTAMMKPAILVVTSTAFENNGMIPAKYTCAGANINPPLKFGNIPAGMKSMVVIVDDPDAPKGTFDHWVMWNIEPTEQIPENSAAGTQGKNGKGKNAYTGPCRPSGTHHYHFKVYALNIKLSNKAGAKKKDIESAMVGHILAQGELVGLYKKSK